MNHRTAGQPGTDHPFGPAPGGAVAVSRSNERFLDQAFRQAGPKWINGFSRPIYHNLMALIYGRKFSKADFGGMIRRSEGGMLHRWAGQLAPGSVIVEIGCYAGLSTCCLASACVGRNVRIFSIDPFASDLEKQASLNDHCVSLKNKPTRAFVQERIRQFGFDSFVELIEGFSQEVVKTWEVGIDFLWIDGNHERAYLDYLDWSPFLNAGARLAIHDAHPGYGLAKVAEDARRIFITDAWEQLEHVKSILTGTLRRPDSLVRPHQRK